MESVPVEFHPGAVAEARAALHWYRSRSESTAEAFLAELDHGVEKIAEQPGIWPRYVSGTRRFVLRRFPFSPIYRQASEKIQIIAIAHGRRKPGYWKNRLLS